MKTLVTFLLFLVVAQVAIVLLMLDQFAGLLVTDNLLHTGFNILTLTIAAVLAGCGTKVVLVDIITILKGTTYESHL